MIDFQNDSISVAFSFNKDLYNRFSSKIWLWVPFWDWKSKIMTFTPKFPKKLFFVKFHFECVFLDQANKKSSKQFKFCEIGGFTGILNKLIFLKITIDFKNSLFHLFSLNWQAFCDNLMIAYITLFLFMLIRDSNYNRFKELPVYRIAFFNAIKLTWEHFFQFENMQIFICSCHLLCMDFNS